MQLESRSRFHAEEHQRQPYSIVGSRYKVIIVLSSYFSSGAPQPTVHTSIIAAKKVSLIFFFRAPIFRSGLEARSNKNSKPIRSVQNADYRLQTGYKIQTRYKMQTADWVQNADWEFLMFLRLIPDSISSYNLPSVTPSLFRHHLSRLFSLLRSIPCPFLDHSRS